MQKTDSAYQLLAGLIHPSEVDRVVAILADPQFDAAGRVHDWRNHVPEIIRANWRSLCDQARVVAYVIAVQAADAEEWD